MSAKPKKVVFDSGPVPPEAGGAQGRAAMPSTRTKMSSERSWEVRLGVTQLVVLWSLCAGVMLAVFLLGVFTGRKQGIDVAMDNLSRDSVRLPIVQPVSNGFVSQEVYDGISAKNANSAAPQVSASATEKSPAIDFTVKSPLQNKVAENPSDVAARSESSAKAAKASSPTDISKSQATAEKTKVAPAESVFGNKPLRADAPTPEKATPAVSATTLSDGEAPAITRSEGEKISIPKGWYVQVSAAKTLAESVAITNKLKVLNYSAKLDQAHVKEVTYYRILVGPYETRDGASAEKDKISRARVSRGEPFLRLMQ